MFSFITNLFNNKHSGVKVEKSNKKTIYKNNDLKITSELVITTSTKKYDKDKLLATLNKQINYTHKPCNYEVDAICPNCNISLPKKPVRKIKCKSCNQYIYIRTHFETKDKILLSEEQLEKYEIEANKHYANNDIKRRLISSFSDVLDEDKNLRSHLNKELQKYKKEWQFGLYRNTLHSLSNLDMLEDKKLDALKKDLTIIYLDINNPRNVGNYVVENNLQKEYPPFKPFDDKCLSAYWLNRIEDKAKELNITDIGKLFIEHNNKVFEDLKVIPHKPEFIWKRIETKFI